MFTMAKYMLLLHDDPSGWLALSPDQMQQAIQKYMAWGAKLRTAGVLVSSDKLADDRGRVLRGKNGQLRVTDGPFSEGKEVLGGYYVIKAESYEEAIERAKDCPHLGYGGTIEVRQVEEMRQ
jgi:hypothetical protein